MNKLNIYIYNLTQEYIKKYTHTTLIEIINESKVFGVGVLHGENMSKWDEVWLIKKTLFSITKFCDDIFKTFVFCMSYGDLEGWNKICQNDFDCSNVSLKEQIMTNWKT